MASSHGPRIPRNGLTYLLDSSNKKSYPGSGTTWYNLAGSTNATLYNSPIHDNNTGIFSFNGSNQYASISQNLTNNCSWSFWYRIDGGGNEQKVFNVAAWTSGDPYNWFEYLVTDPYNTNFSECGWAYSYKDGARIDMQLGNAAKSNGSWRHILIVINNGNARGYYDGVKYATAPTFALNNLTEQTNHSGFQFGRGRNYNYQGAPWGYANCSFNLVHGWNRALTEKEALLVYPANKARFGV